MVGVRPPERRSIPAGAELQISRRVPDLGPGPAAQVSPVHARSCNPRVQRVMNHALDRSPADVRTAPHNSPLPVHTGDDIDRSAFTRQPGRRVPGPGVHAEAALLLFAPRLGPPKTFQWSVGRAIQNGSRSLSTVAPAACGEGATKPLFAAGAKGTDRVGDGGRNGECGADSSSRRAVPPAFRPALEARRLWSSIPGGRRVP